MVRLPFASLCAVQGFASTDEESQRRLHPAQPARRAACLCAGEMERLWSTASEPDNIALQLELGAATARRPLRRAGGQPSSTRPSCNTMRLLAGRARTHAPTSNMGEGAALVSTNYLSKQPIVVLPGHHSPAPAGVAEASALHHGAPRIVDAKRLLKTGQRSLARVDVAGA
jgi:hypothetical protein